MKENLQKKLYGIGYRFSDHEYPEYKRLDRLGKWPEKTWFQKRLLAVRVRQASGEL